jgi:hypothetical protein
MSNKNCIYLRLQAPFTIINGILSSVESYKISYYYDGEGISTESFPSPSNGVIEFQISICPRNSVNVYISAISRLGEGQSSDPYTAGTLEVQKLVAFLFSLIGKNGHSMRRKSESDGFW